MDTLFLATEAGLVTVRRETNRWQVVDRAVQDQHVTSVAAHNGIILAGTTQGIQRSSDGGQHWTAVNEGLTSLHIRWIAFHPGISDLAFAGTEPAEIFVSRDGAEHWHSCPEVAMLRD